MDFNTRVNVAFVNKSHAPTIYYFSYKPFNLVQFVSL